MATIRPPDSVPTEDAIVVELLSRFRYNPAMGTPIHENQAAKYDFSIYQAAALLTDPQPLPATRAELSPEAVAEAMEIWQSRDEEEFDGAIGVALDQPGLKPYGLLNLERALDALFSADSGIPSVRLAVVEVLGPAAAGFLQKSLPFASAILRGIELAMARIPPSLQGHAPADPNDPFAWFFAEDVPVEIGGVLLDRAQIGVLTALVLAAEQNNLVVPSRLALCWVKLWQAFLSHILSAVLGMRLVELPEAAILGVKPLDLEAIWATHKLRQRQWDRFHDAAKASGLSVFPPPVTLDE